MSDLFDLCCYYEDDGRIEVHRPVYPTEDSVTIAELQEHGFDIKRCIVVWMRAYDDGVVRKLTVKATVKDLQRCGFKVGY
jgi:hypothetical protein